MERAYESRRSASSAGRGGRRRQQGLDPREKRRFVQLAVSIGLFLIVLLGRGVLPSEQLTQWKARLNQDTDFKGAFSRFGAAVSRGDAVPDALGELWVEVFAGGGVPVGEPSAVWTALPTFSQHMAQELLSPGDPVGRWVRAARAAEQTAGLAHAAGGAVPTAQTLVLRPLAATAQLTAPDGRKLPGRVSLERYDLGLDRTVLPVSAPLTSGFGFREQPIQGGEDFHLGVDLGAPLGTEVAAYAGGIVSFAGENSTYGKYIRIDHGGRVATIYAHCSKLLVKEGQRVAAGDAIALVGQTGDATGPHLHFAVQKDGIFLDPLHYIVPEG